MNHPAHIIPHIHNYSGFVLTRAGLRAAEAAAMKALADNAPVKTEIEAMERGRVIGLINVVVAPSGTIRLA